MKQVFYHQDSKAPLLLDVIRKNSDGTFDLGLDGSVVVSSCLVTETPAPGAATFTGGTPKASSKSAKKAANEPAEEPAEEPADEVASAEELAE